jgi:predicted metal-dependent phosphoesterase TrpH
VGSEGINVSSRVDAAALFCPTAAAGLLTTNVRVLKVELHSHSSADPCDRIPHSTRDLIDRAAQLGYHALAITLHERQLDLGPYVGYAAERGITLIPGIERSIQGKHVLLLNFRSGGEGVHSFDDLARLRQRERGLVVAPHPFFPDRSCLHGLIDRHAALFDAVEYNAMFTRAINFNERAVRWANERGKPVVGNGDVHRLRQLGTTYSLVEAEPHPDAICEAIRAGRVQVAAEPLSLLTAARLMGELFAGTLFHRPDDAASRDAVRSC